MFCQKKSINEGDLIAKCYFAKKKIVWEVLERALKSKIEIQWSDIIGIKATLQHSHYGLLEIEVYIYYYVLSCLIISLIISLLNLILSLNNMLTSY